MKLTNDNQCPNIVNFFGYKKIRSNEYIKMELCQSSLIDHINDDYTVDEILNIGLDIAKGLQCIHNIPMFHRDLKLDNIFICNGEYKIGDFGLSKHLTNEDLLKRQHSHKIIDRKLNYYYHYDVGLKKYSIEIDTYSLGIILYQLIKKGDITDEDIEIFRGNNLVPEFENIDDENLSNMFTYIFRKGSKNIITIDYLIIILEKVLNKEQIDSHDYTQDLPETEDDIPEMPDFIKEYEKIKEKEINKQMEALETNKIVKDTSYNKKEKKNKKQKHKHESKQKGTNPIRRLRRYINKKISGE